ncbi:MAG: anti-sigma factor [Caulobacteraceae bacterium]
MSGQDPTPDEKREGSLLAAELALGVLDEPERGSAEARATADPAFAAEVDDWRGRLAPLLEKVAPTPPPATVWARIDAALSEPPASLARARPLRGPAADRFTRGRLWPSPVRWRFAGLGAMAASIVWIAVLVGLHPSRGGPAMTAALAPAPGARPYWIATLDTASGELRLTPASAEPPDARARELWLIPAGGRPLRVGLFAPDRSGKVRLDTALRAKTNSRATLAVSLEPPGGSPTGAPTGPVIATGKLTPI